MEEKSTGKMAIFSLAYELRRLYDDAYELYCPLVGELLRGNASEADVEKILDYLLNFCTDDRFVLLYKKVCRRYYMKYPNLISDYVFIYLDLYQNEKASED